MIKRDVLISSDKPDVRYRKDDAAAISVDLIQQLLEIINRQSYELPIDISVDQVKSGGLFNSSVEDCVIITNTEHPMDYFKYCLILQKQGKMAYLRKWYYGNSTLTRKSAQNGGRGGFLGFGGVNQAAFDAEYNYYDMLDELIQEAVG